MEATVSQTPPTDLFKRVSLPLYQARGWLRFLAVMSILEGILDVLTIVGVIVAWLPIWLGVLLFQAAGDAERAGLSGEAAALESANRRLKLYFLLRGLTILVQILLLLAAFSLFGTLGILGALSEMQ
jgi:hypothetical protein